jgi:putative PIN family toxin of toxin-antitoxin system
VRSITFDSSVLIAGLNYAGAGARLLGMVQAGTVRLDTSEAILDEAFGILRDKFGWDGYRMHATRDRITRIANVVKPTSTVNVVTDEPDNRILECSAEARSDYIVTRDKRLLRVGQYEGAKIVDVEELLNQLRPGRDR